MHIVFGGFPRTGGANANAKPFGMSEAEEREVNELVDLFRGMGFKRSAEISRYIRAHRLGNRFPNISGFLQLEKRDGDIVDTWEFEGGIKPRFYREVCRRLDLDNNGSQSRVTGFESYRQRAFAGMVEA